MNDWLTNLRCATDTEGVVVLKGCWLCKPAMWMSWQHKGLLEARSHSELLHLSCIGVKRSLREYPDIKSVVKPYGEIIARKIASNTFQGMDDHKFPIDHELIVHELPTEVRHLMSMPGLDHLKRQAKFHVKNKSTLQQRIDNLEEDVVGSKCDLVLEPAGVVRCIVTVAVLCITRPAEEHTVMVQLGHMSSSSTTTEPMNVDAFFDMPGVRIRPGETPRDAIQRLLYVKFPKLADLVNVGESLEPRVEYVHNPSPLSDMLVTYVRYEFRVSLQEGFSSMLVPVKLPDYPAGAGDMTKRWSAGRIFSVPVLRRGGTKDGLASLRPSNASKGDTFFPYEFDNAFALALGSEFVSVVSFCYKRDFEAVVAEPSKKEMQEAAIRDWLLDQAVQAEISAARRLVCL